MTAPQRTPEWYAQRRGRVTGSAVGAIMGLSPFATREDVLRSMVREFHGAASEFTGNAATEYGNFHEDGAKWDFEIDTGLVIQPCGFFTYEDWLGASPDGLIGDNALVEIKCPFGLRDAPAPVKFKPLSEQPHYELQIQVQLFVTQRQVCHFWQWANHGRLHEIVHARDITEELRHLRAFYDFYLSELDNPDHLKPRRVQVNTNKADKLLAEYDELSETLDRAAERKKDILAELVQMAGERDADVCGRKLTKVEQEGAVSYAKVVKDHLPTLDLAPYRGKASVFWKLT